MSEPTSEPKFANNAEVVEHFTLRLRHNNVLFIGKVRSAVWKGDKWLYTCNECPTTPDGWFVAWEHDLAPATDADREDVKRQLAEMEQ